MATYTLDSIPFDITEYNKVYVFNANDYYSFGMLIDSRSYSSGTGYRWGFNGKEMDNEISGNGNQYDYGFRIYNSRLGKFLSVDPLTKDYPMLSTYQYASNCPITGIDIDGLEFYFAADGSLLGSIGTSQEVRLVTDNKNIEKVKNLINTVNSMQTSINKGIIIDNSDNIESRKIIVDSKNEVDILSKPVGMTVDELYTRAFLSTIKETENGCNKALPYNAKHGFKDGKINVFTNKTYEESKDDYKEHPYKDSKGSSAAGAYQMLNSTFAKQKEINPNVKDFGPNSQDYAVLGVIDGVGALDDIMSGNFDLAVQKLTKDQWGNTQFASLPGGGEQSHGLTMDKFNSMLKNNISNELNGKSNISLAKGKINKEIL